MKQLLKPNKLIIITTVFLFFIFNIFFIVCSPIEVEGLTLNGGFRNTTYQCGIISKIIFTIRGSAWIRNNSYNWLIYLISAYLLSCVLNKLFVKPHKK